MSTRLVLSVDVAAPPEVTWAAVTDWRRQGEWMLGTVVRPTQADGRGVGARIEAFTGAGRIGFTDPMEITAWEPPFRCGVRHLGRVVRGSGVFAVEPVGDAASRFVWQEDLDLPFGAVGRLGFAVVRPLFVLGVRRSLDAFAGWVLRSQRAGRTAA